MLRLLIQSTPPALVCGLSAGNVARLGADQPIQFSLSEYGWTGDMIILRGGEADAATAREVMGPLPAAILALGQAQLATMQKTGEVLTLPLRTLGLPTEGTVLVFASHGDELRMLADLRAGGIIDDEAEIDGLDEYLAHAENRFPGCPWCAARRPHLEWSGEALSSEQSRPGLRGFVERQPTLAALLTMGLVVLLATAVGLTIEHYRAAPEPPAQPPPPTEPAEPFVPLALGNGTSRPCQVQGPLKGFDVEPGAQAEPGVPPFRLPVGVPKAAGDPLSRPRGVSLVLRRSGLREAAGRVVYWERLGGQRVARCASPEVSAPGERPIDRFSGALRKGLPLMMEIE